MKGYRADVLVDFENNITLTILCNTAYKGALVRGSESGEELQLSAELLSLEYHLTDELLRLLRKL
jgi:hypothetical protein